MKVFTLEISGDSSIHFTGELVASAANSDSKAVGSRYNGKTGQWEDISLRWTELALYKTDGGQFVCHQIERRRKPSEQDSFMAKLCDTPEEVKSFFGHGWLANELYSEASIYTYRPIVR